MCSTLREFLSEVCDAVRGAGLRRHRTRRQRRAPALKPSGPVLPSFGAIPRCSRVRGRAATDDLRRARTPADPIRSRPAAVGPARTDLVPHRNAERHGGRRRLRVRHRRPGQRRRGRRGGRGYRLLRAGSGDHSVTHPHAHTRTDSFVPPGADAHPDSPTAAEAAGAHPHPGPHSHSEADAHTAPEARPTAAARHRGAPARPHPDAHAQAETDAHAEPTSGGVTDPGELPAVPGPVPLGGQALRPVPRLARPARHRARGVRRRRPASALTSGGTSCRNGLFSPSRWGRPVWSSSSWP